MFNIIRKYAAFIFSHAWTREENERVINLIDSKKNSRIVDLGSGDGKLTVLFARKAKASVVVGVEGVKMNPDNAAKKIKFITANLNKKLPFKDNSFDIVISHFSLEHLYNTCSFVKETKRILKKGGYTLVATDNLASWPNIFSLIIGWQPFTTAYRVGNKTLGNSFANGGFVSDDQCQVEEFGHNKVLSYKMLVDVYEEFGFKIEKIVGIGYFPFFGLISRLLCKIDKRHSHLLIVKARK
jgi:SAM-dependent methyltransferase